MSNILSIIILICTYSFALPPLLISQDPVIFTLGIVLSAITCSITYFYFKTLYTEVK